MPYLEYETTTKQVVEIHNEIPTIEGKYDYAISPYFMVGDEFELTIYVNDVDENKNLLSHTAIRNNPNAQRLLRENAELKRLNQDLTLATFDLAETIALQNVKMREQEEALFDIANTLAEVTR